MGQQSSRGNRPNPAEAEQCTSIQSPVGNFDDNHFTENEKVILRGTWSVLEQDMNDTGARVFARIFTLSPEAKQLFPFKEVEGEELLRHPLFRGHGLRFMTAVGGTVNQLDALDLIVMPNLSQLGKTHTKFKGFTLDHLDVFVEAMDNVWAEELGEEYNIDTKEAWNKLFHLIVSNIADGFKEGIISDKGKQ